MEVTGEESVVAALDALRRALDVDLLADECAAVLLNRIRTRFLSERDPDGKPWVPSLAGTLRKRGREGGTLFDTGRLFRSIQLYSEGRGRRAIGTDVPYGPFLQYSKRTPRVFLGIGEDDEHAIRQVIEHRINEAVG